MNEIERNFWRIFTVLGVAFAIVIMLWPIIADEIEETEPKLQVEKLANAIAESEFKIENSSTLQIASARGLLPNLSYLRAVAR